MVPPDLMAPGGAVADLEEAHQAGGFAAARQFLVRAAQGGEIGAGARAIFEQPRFAGPQIHDAAFIDQIVLDALDEAGMRLGMFIGRGGFGQPPGLVVDIIMALAGAIDAIGPVQAGVEPLRRVGRAFLRRQHVAELVIEGAGVGFRRRNSRPSSPNRSRCRPGGRTPAWRNARRWSPCASLALLAPQEFRHAFFRHRLQGLGHARLAEIFLRQHIAGDLAPAFRHLDAVLGEDDGAVRVADLAGGGAEGDALVGRMTFDREMAANAHGGTPK